MTNLTGPFAKNSFHQIPPDSTGMTGIQQEPQGQGKDLSFLEGLELGLVLEIPKTWKTRLGLPETKLDWFS